MKTIKVAISRKRTMPPPSKASSASEESPDFNPLSMLGRMGTPLPSEQPPPLKKADYTREQDFDFEDDEPSVQPISFGPTPGKAASARAADDPFPSARPDPELLSFGRRAREREAEQEVERQTEDLANALGVTKHGKKVPVNKDIIDRAERYRAEIADSIRDNISDIREFFLDEVIPFFMSVSNGLGDAVDVAKLALEEEPSAASYRRFMEGLANDIVRVKTLTFMQKTGKLTDDERRLFLLSYLTQSGILQSNGDLTQTLLREVLAVADLQRSTKEDTQALVRKVSSVKGDRKSARPRSDADRTRRRKS